MTARRPDSGSRTAAALVILSETLTPAQLEALIGLQPDRRRPKGEPVAGGRGRRRFTVWRIDEGDAPASAESQLAKILERIEGVADRVRRLGADPRIHSVSLWIWSGGEEFGLDLTPGQLEKVSRLSASLKIDVYDVGDGSGTETGGDGDPRTWPDWWDTPIPTTSN